MQPHCIIPFINHHRYRSSTRRYTSRSPSSAYCTRLHAPRRDTNTCRSCGSYGIERCRMAIGIPIAPGRSQAAARLEEAKPLCLGTSPFSWTCGLGCFGRPGGRECSVLHHSERMPPPLKLHAPSLSTLSGSTMRAAAYTRHSGNAAHAERGPTCMCVRRAPSRARLRVAPPGSASSRRLCPAVCRRD